MEEYRNLPENALAKKVQVGDYVAYDPTKGVTDTSKLTYTSPVGSGPSHGNGHSEQTFTANNSIEWRVLSKNENTGEVILISEPIKNNAGVGFTMKGAIGYLYAEQELNEICKVYGYGVGADTTKTFTYETGDVVEGIDRGTITGSGARSINVDDINKITGYEPTTFTTSDTEGTTYNYGNSYTHSIFYPTKATQDGKSTGAVNRSDVYTTYWYIGSEALKDLTASYQTLFRNKTNASYISYWIASRAIDSRSDLSGFTVFCVHDTYEGFVFPETIGGGNAHEWKDGEYDLSICSIVYLKPNVKTSGQNESGAWEISE